MAMDIEDRWRRLETTTMDLLSEDLYQRRIQEALEMGQTRIEINIDHLRQQDSSLPELILNHPSRALQLMETALEGAVRSEMEAAKKSSERYRVGLEGSFGSHHISPRGLLASLSNKLVKLQGIVTRMSLVRPKLLSSQHYCERTKKFLDKQYADAFELGVLSGAPPSNAIPSHDPEGNPYSFEYGLSIYKNHQTLTVQELPERSPAGQLPRSSEIVLEEDLVDRVKPGDRVEVVGVFKTLGVSGAQGVFRTVVVANNVKALAPELGAPEITGEDLRHIRQVAARPDALLLLARSVAPSIFGHDQVKKALLLLLLGGAEKNLSNGTHLRGDLNVLLVGDPSTAKSQLLRSVLHLAPLAASTTGRGASGVGLTAAVSFDRETGERQLEAGAMVLADRGVVCIDEFDKMNELDRVAIHEVMEQQTVTIAKAGIHASLNARCSVLAAANPLYGTYQRDKSPSWNIALPDSLLSRFDLLFVVLDQKQPEIDRLIAGRVVANHLAGRPAGFEDMELESPVVEPLPAAEIKQEESQIFTATEEMPLLHRSFLRKYLHFAKKTAQPVLSDEASVYISQAWAELRHKETEDGKRAIVPITVRTLETLIRLATATAKAVLASQITLEHAQTAHKLLRFAVYHEEETPEETAPPEPEPVPAVEARTTRRRKRGKEDPAAVASAVQQIALTPARVTAAMKKHVFKVMAENAGDTPSFKVDYLWSLIQGTRGHQIEDQDHLLRIIKVLDNENKVYYHEDEQLVTLL